MLVGANSLCCGIVLVVFGTDAVLVTGGDVDAATEVFLLWDGTNEGADTGSAVSKSSQTSSSAGLGIKLEPFGRDIESAFA